MIAIISGLPGSGKTLSAIKRFIIPASKEGRKIYTNVEGLKILGLSIFVDVPYEKMEKNLIAKEGDTDEPFKFSTKRLINDVAVNSLVIIDEAQTIWNNRDYASEENKTLLPFLQKHRHYGIDIVFLTQNIDQLDIGIRRLTQVHYRLRRLSNSGLDKVVKVDIYPDAMGSEQFKPMTTNVWTIDRGIFGFYSSYDENTVKEAKKPVGNIILKNPRIIFAMIALTVCGILAFRTLTGKGKGIFAPDMINKKFDGFDLGDYNEYYCGSMFYVLRCDGTVDSIPPKNIPPKYCPKVDYTFIRGCANAK